jgi:anti-anti-sigma factor
VTSAFGDLERDDRLDAVVARLQGDIDSSNVASVIVPLGRQAEGKRLVLDLSDVRYIDSAGIAAIEALRSSVELSLVVPGPSTIRRALQIVGFDQIVPVFERIEDIEASTA